jgi:hypothetical protein
MMTGPTVVYYDGFGQGYYGGNSPSYGAAYVLVPNNGYSGYGNGPYGNYRGYGNPGHYDPFYGRTFAPSTYRYRVSPRFGYYSGF